LVVRTTSAARSRVGAMHSAMTNASGGGEVCAIGVIRTPSTPYTRQLST